MAKRKKTVKRRSYPKTSRNIKRAKPKRRFLFIPWPALTMLLLCTGIFLVGWTFFVGATDIKVTAKIAAPLPTDPAIIQIPADGQHFASQPIMVTGTCPLDSYVEIYRDDIFSGTDVCTIDGTFSIEVALFNGPNILKARIFNITDDEGPASTPITVYYDEPPAPPASNPGSSGGAGGGSSTPSGATAAQPFILNLASDFSYTGYHTDDNIEIKLVTGGGSPPYKFNIDWGDANQTLSISKPGEFTITHKYTEPGKHTRSSYIIKIAGTDSAGRKTSLQFFIIINSKTNSPGVVVGSASSNTPIGKVNSKNWLWVAWPAYGLVLFMALSYWLGEHEAMLVLKRKGTLRRRA